MSNLDRGSNMSDKYLRRYLGEYIKSDLKEKMVFLSGPRQVGKTTLALHLLGGDENHPAYFDWDYANDRKKFLSMEFPPDQKLLVFDEIHKYSRWRNYLKGLYDKTKSKREYLITGSARLDMYKRGGDALTGRYHSYLLHPLSISEIDKHCSLEAAKSLLRYSGFPEPFKRHSDKTLRRWHVERQQQVLKDDLRDLEKVEDVVLVSLLAERMPDLIGSPLSINALREDLRVAHRTVQNWLNILERLFILFRIAPLGSPKIRAVKKEMKAYMWDWSVVKDEGVRFENFVACQLLKYCNFVENSEGCPMELRYIRDTDRREVDFVVLKSGKPVFAVEAKLKDTAVPQSMIYFAERLKIDHYYLVHMEQKDYEHATYPLRVLPINRFVKECCMP